MGYSFLYESAFHNSGALPSKSSDCRKVNTVSSCYKEKLTVGLFNAVAFICMTILHRELFHAQQWHNSFQAPMTVVTSTTSAIHIFTGDFVTYIHSTLGSSKAVPRGL